MSERGSFCTEYIYCKKCLTEANKVLISQHKGLCSLQIPTTDGELYPIIAGKIGGRGPFDEVIYMREMAAELEQHLCHPMRIAVLAENGEEIITVIPWELQ